VSVKKLIVATRNQGKVKEIKKLIGEVPLQILSLNEITGIPPVEEDRDTFEGNALKKAEIVSRYTGEAVLADDSGLEVDVLGGRPGVYSARFAGENASDAGNNARLLKEMEGIEDQRRTARFRCVMVLVFPEKKTVTVEGTCEGYITRQPRGSGGFGYDPVFFYPPLHCTLASLSSQEKNRISHRGEALSKVKQLIEAL